MDTTFKMRSGFKVFFWILAVFCTILIILIPAAVLIVWIAYTAEVKMNPDTLEVKWIGRKIAPWKDITELKWLPAHGGLKRAMRPLSFKAMSDGKKIAGGIPVGVFERTEELLAELQKRSGKTIS